VSSFRMLDFPFWETANMAVRSSFRLELRCIPGD